MGFGAVRLGRSWLARFREAGVVRCVAVEYGRAARGRHGQFWLVVVGRCVVRLGMAGMVRLGRAGLGRYGFGWRGPLGKGKSWLGMAWQARSVMVRSVTAGQGLAGSVWLGLVCVIAYSVLHYQQPTEGGRMLTEAERKQRHKIAKAKYDKKTVQYVFRFRLGADADIVDKLASVPNKTDYLRQIIREDVSRGA